MRTFQNLSAYDFELLIRDLLTAEHNLRYEAFSAGPDGGIDLRATHAGRTTIVQCKHYLRSSDSALLRDLSLELARLPSLKPDRYIIATTASVTPATKQKLLKTFSPYIQATEDILGPEDIDGLINRHPNVELANPKLWMLSGAVVANLVHGSISRRTEAVIARLQDTLKAYVTTTHLLQAKQALKSAGCCIIKGPAGSGKTTLAQAIIAHALAEQYEPVLVSSDVDEAFAMLAPDRKQLIIYDDFLGHSTTAELLDKNEDTRLLELLEFVKRSRNTRLVTTTRDYILAYALEKYELLKTFLKATPEVVLTLGTYDIRTRAHILYNHLYHSGLSPNALKNFRDVGATKKVLEHHNFNPRLVASFPGLVQGRQVAEQGPTTLFAYLDDPRELWKSLINSFPTVAMDVLMVMATLPSDVDVVDVLRAVNSYTMSAGRGASRPDLQHTIRVLDGTFIKSTGFASYKVDGRSYVDFANHSVRDFALDHLDQLTDVDLGMLCESAVFWEQVALLGNLAFQTSGGELYYLTGLVRYGRGESDRIPRRLKEYLQSQAGALARAAIRTIQCKPARTQSAWHQHSLLQKLATVLSWGPTFCEALEKSQGIQQVMDGLSDNPEAREVSALARASQQSGEHALRIVAPFLNRTLEALIEVVEAKVKSPRTNGSLELFETHGEKVHDMIMIAEACNPNVELRRRLDAYCDALIADCVDMLEKIIGYVALAFRQCDVDRDFAEARYGWRHEFRTDERKTDVRAYLPDPETLEQLASRIHLLCEARSRRLTAEQERAIRGASAISQLSQRFLRKRQESSSSSSAPSSPKSPAGETDAEFLSGLFGRLGDE